MSLGSGVAFEAFSLESFALGLLVPRLSGTTLRQNSRHPSCLPLPVQSTARPLTGLLLVPSGNSPVGKDKAYVFSFT